MEGHTAKNGGFVEGLWIVPRGRMEGMEGMTGFWRNCPEQKLVKV